MVMSVTQERRRWTGISVVGVPMSHQNPTKTEGDPLNVTWTVHNPTAGSRRAQLSLKNASLPNGPEIGVAGPVSVPPGVQIALMITVPSLAIGFNMVEGANGLQARMWDVDAGVLAGFHEATLTLLRGAPPPQRTKTEVLAKAQALAGSTPAPDTRFFVGRVLADWNNDGIDPDTIINPADPAVALKGGPLEYVFDLPGESGRSWDDEFNPAAESAWEYWVNSGKLLYIPG